MRASGNCIDFIKRFEKARLIAWFNGASKLYEIGYGSETYQDGTTPLRYDTITEEKATDLLAFHVERDSFAVYRRLSHKDLRQTQFDALVSLVNDISITRFTESEFYKLILNDCKDLKYLRASFLALHKVYKNKKPYYHSGKMLRRQDEWRQYLK